MPFAMTSGRAVQVRDDDGSVIETAEADVRMSRDVVLARNGWTRIGDWFPNDEGAAALVMRERGA